MVGSAVDGSSPQTPAPATGTRSQCPHTQSGANSGRVVGVNSGRVGVNSGRVGANSRRSRHVVSPTSAPECKPGLSEAIPP
eukprot:310087-Prorocentrum_minimum.AAC.1